jgi:hypothetical protein
VLPEAYGGVDHHSISLQPYEFLTGGSHVRNHRIFLGCAVASLRFSLRPLRADWTGKVIMSALEAMQWHDENSVKERSDAQVIAEDRRFDLVEKRTEPLDLTADEQLEFLSEYCSGYQHIAATGTKHEQYMVFGEWFETTRARTLSEAICLAAARFEEDNS